MNCKQVRRDLPGYLDDGIPDTRRAAVRAHLEQCTACREELLAYARLSSHLSQLPCAAPPADLPLRIRLAAARQGDRRRWLAQAWAHARVRLENLLEPFAVPATGGVVTALLVFAVVFHQLLVGVPLGAVPDDLPISLLQPARVEALAAFPITAPGEDEELGPLVVSARVSASGQVTDFEIVAGPNSIEVQRQVYQVLMFSRFRPQMNFGRPEPGQVLLQFSEVRVRG